MSRQRVDNLAPVPIDVIDRAARRLRLVETLLSFQSDIQLDTDRLTTLGDVVSDQCDQLEAALSQLLAADAAARPGGVR